jgi:hypothetical protein
MKPSALQTNWTSRPEHARSSTARVLQLRLRVNTKQDVSVTRPS